MSTLRATQSQLQCPPQQHLPHTLWVSVLWYVERLFAKLYGFYVHVKRYHAQWAWLLCIGHEFRRLFRMKALTLLLERHGDAGWHPLPNTLTMVRTICTGANLGWSRLPALFLANSFPCADSIAVQSWCMRHKWQSTSHSSSVIAIFRYCSISNRVRSICAKDRGKCIWGYVSVCATAIGLYQLCRIKFRAYPPEQSDTAEMFSSICHSNNSLAYHGAYMYIYMLLSFLLGWFSADPKWDFAMLHIILQ